MSESNPYQPVADSGAGHVLGDPAIRKVSVHPIDLMKRGHALMGDQYLLMVGVLFVAMLVGSLVPMGLIMGAMLVGVYLCFLQREQFGRTEFGTLFKGFDFFLESFLVVLAAGVLGLVVVLPVQLVMFGIMVAMMSGAENNPEAAMGGMFLFMAVFMIVVFVLMLFVYLPFLFAFQLIADRHYKAMQAIKYSWRASIANLGGIIWLQIVLGAISYVGILACYVPFFFLLPLVTGALFVLYRDIFGPGLYPPPPLPPAVGMAPPMPASASDHPPSDNPPPAATPYSS